VFKLFNFYNKKITNIPQFVIYIITFIEFTQSLYFIINPDLQIYPENSILIHTITATIGYASAFPVIKNNTGMINFFYIILIFLWLIINVFLIYFSYTKIAQQHTLIKALQKSGLN